MQAPVPQATRSPSPSTAETLQHLHSYNRACFHQLMRQRLEAQQRPSLSQTPRQESGSAVPDDPRYDPSAASRAPPSVLVRAHSATPRVADTDASPQPRRPPAGTMLADKAVASASQTPQSTSGQQSRVRSTCTARHRGRARSLLDGGTTPRTHVDALEAFGPEQLYAAEDQQPLSARSQSTTVGVRASSASSSTSSRGSVLVEGVMETEARPSRPGRVVTSAHTDPHGVADGVTLRRLLGIDDGRHPTTRARGRPRAKNGAVVRFKDTPTALAEAEVGVPVATEGPRNLETDVRAAQQAAEMDRLRAEVHAQRAELSHLRAALVVASNHVSKSFSATRSAALEKKCAQVLAVASVIGSRTAGDDPAALSSSSTDAVAAVLRCLDETDPRRSSAASSAGTLALDRLLRGIPVVPLKPPSTSLRERLSVVLQRPLCGVVMVWLPRTLMSDAPPRRAVPRDAQQTLRATEDMARPPTTLGAFTLSASAPTPSPSPWALVLDLASSSVAETFEWCPCFVVADDRAITLFHSAEDYAAGAYARALLTVPYTALSSFLPDLRTALQADSVHRDVKPHADVSPSLARHTTDATPRTPGPRGARRGLLSRLLSRSHRRSRAEEDANEDICRADGSSRGDDGPAKESALSRHLTSLLRTDKVHHYFGFVPSTSGQAAGPDRTQLRLHKDASTEAPRPQDEVGLWSLSRSHWAQRPPLLFRTASQQVYEGWVHGLVQRFHSPLYLDLFPRFVEHTLAAASCGTQAGGDGEEVARGAVPQSENKADAAAGRAHHAVATQTHTGAVVAVRDLVAHVTVDAAALPSTPAVAPPSVIDAQPPHSLTDSAVPTPITSANLVHASAELRKLLEKKNEQLVATEAALRASQQRVEELLADQRQLQGELSAARAVDADHEVVDGKLHEELTRLRTVAERTTAELAQLRAQQGTTQKNSSTSPSALSAQKAVAEEEEDVITVMRAERETWIREKEELLQTQQRLAAEVLALRKGSTEGLRALARRAVGDIDLLHGEMMKETNSLIRSASVSPIQASSHPRLLKRGVVRAPPGLPRQETDIHWSALDSGGGRAVRATAAEPALSADGDSYFSDLQCGVPEVASAPPPSAMPHPYGSPGDVQSPRPAAVLAHNDVDESLISTPGRQLFSTLVAPGLSAPRSSHDPPPPTSTPASPPAAAFAQLLLSFDPRRRVMDGDLALDGALTRLLSSGPSKHAQGRHWEVLHQETGVVLTLTMSIAVAKGRATHARERQLRSRRAPSSASQGGALVSPGVASSLEEAAIRAVPWTSPHPYSTSFQSIIQPVAASTRAEVSRKKR